MTGLASEKILVLDFGSQYAQLIARRVRELRALPANDTLNPDSVANVFSLEGMYDLSREVVLRGTVASKLIFETLPPLPRARSRTTLHITGVTWQPSKELDFRAEYRTARQSVQLNHRDGAAFEAGYTVKDKIRVGIGYNFSSFSDDEFAYNSHAFTGVFFIFSGKI